MIGAAAFAAVKAKEAVSTKDTVERDKGEDKKEEKKDEKKEEDEDVEEVTVINKIE